MHGRIPRTGSPVGGKRWRCGSRRTQRLRRCAGQPIRRWFKQWKSAKGEAFKGAGDLYDRLMGKVRAAIKDQKIQSVSFKKIFRL